MNLAVQSNATTRCWGLSSYFRSRSNAVSGDASPAECSWTFHRGLLNSFAPTNDDLRTETCDGPSVRSAGTQQGRQGGIPQTAACDGPALRPVGTHQGRQGGITHLATRDGAAVRHDGAAVRRDGAAVRRVGAAVRRVGTHCGDQERARELGGRDSTPLRCRGRKHSRRDATLCRPDPESYRSDQSARNADHEIGATIELNTPFPQDFLSEIRRGVSFW